MLIKPLNITLSIILPCFNEISTIEEVIKKVKTIIVEKNKLNNNLDFVCRSENLKRVSRNNFLEKKVYVDFCILKN